MQSDQSQGETSLSVRTLPYQYSDIDVGDSSLKFLPSNLKYSANTRPLRQNAERLQLPFSPEELDSLDDAIEQIVSQNQSAKASIKSKIAAAYESLKRRFVRVLDNVFDDIQDFGECDSEYAKFELMCGDFQDKKSDYEMDASAQAQSALHRSLVNLLCFDKARGLFGFVTVESIEKTLGAYTEVFGKWFKELEEDDYSETFRSLEQQLNSARVNDDDFLRHFNAEPSSLRLQEARASDSQQQSKACFTARLDEYRLKLMQCAPGGGQESGDDALLPDKDFPRILEQFSKNSTNGRRKKSINCYILNRKPHILLFESGQTDSDETSRLFAADARSVDVSAEPVLDLGYKISSLSISPDDGYIGIMDDSDDAGFYLYGLSALGRVEAQRVSYTDQFDVSRFVFVDSPEGTKLVFVDARGQLGVIDLEACALDFLMAHSLKIQSLFYVDASSVLVFTEKDEFGLFCLDSLSITGLVRFTAQQFEETPDSYDRGESIYAKPWNNN